MADFAVKPNSLLMDSRAVWSGSPHERGVWRRFVSLFRRPARLQIAALCYRESSEGELEVLLVATQTTGRWILPKGWPIVHRKAHRTAKVEAYEEAGVVGQVQKTPYATFRSYKGLNSGMHVRTVVLVYLIEVEELLEEYPEATFRKRTWLPIDEAITRADDDGVKAVLDKFRTEMAEKVALTGA